MDVNGGIRESQYEGQWTGGQPNNKIADAKIGSPVAATSKGLTNIRVYYISNDNKLQEACYDAGKGWYNGDLNHSNFVVAPYSKLAASFLAVGSALQLRVYAQQQDNKIQEYGYDNGSSGWQQMTNLGSALPGSEIASTSFRTSKLCIRVYFQLDNMNLIEKCYDSAPWYTGGFSVQNALPRCPIAATSFNASANGVSLRVYFATNDNRIVEKGYDSSNWYDGGFSVNSIPGSEAAVINWGGSGGINLRVYFQKGIKVTGVTEWVWNGGWSQGAAGIPPA
ncbi:MAG: hypothetical protein M1839_006595 [Geoglossum umbratile]|nr:MAG: hypothetical protein M1839_006595 [Geoglossum umbratile]